MIVQQDFLGGLYIPDSHDGEIPPNALLTADDLEFLPDRSLRGRRGRTLFSNLGLGPFSALWRHYPKSGSARWLGVIDSGVSVIVRHDPVTPGVFTPITDGVGFTTGKRFQAVSWPSKDKTFLANGEILLAYDGVAMHNVSYQQEAVNHGVPILGPYLTYHQFRLFGTTPAEIKYSVYATAINDENQSPGIQLNVSDNEAGDIVGLGSLPDRLVVQKTTCLWSLLGDVEVLAGTPLLTKYSNKGALSDRAIAYDEAGFWFNSKDGIYWSDGQSPDPVEVSYPIRSYFQTHSGNRAFPNAVANYYPRKLMYVIKLDPTDAFTYRCQKLRIPGKKGTAYLWSRNTNEPMTCIGVAASEQDSGNYFVGDSDGKIYECDTGATDNGQFYFPVAQIGASKLGQLGEIGRVHKVFVEFRGRDLARVGLRYDNHASDDLVLRVGRQETGPTLQQTKTKVSEQRTFGRYVSARITLPAADGPEGALYSVRLDPRLRSRRVWR